MNILLANIKFRIQDCLMKMLSNVKLQKYSWQVTTKETHQSWLPITNDIININS